MGGYLVGLTSIGSGSVMAVILLLLYPIAPAVIVGTDITHAMVLSFVVGIAHMTQGNVNFGLAGTLLLGSIPGVLIGSRLAPWIPGKPLKTDTGHHADLRGDAPASRALTRYRARAVADGAVREPPLHAPSLAVGFWAVGFRLQASGLADQAAVHEEGASRGVGGGVRGQVDGHGGDILGLPDLAEGNL